jgi:hypothetical protein
MSTAAAWVAPTQDALAAAASVYQQADAQGTFALHPAAAGILSAFTGSLAGKPKNVGASAPANVPRPPPPPPPGIVDRVTTWARFNPITAGLAALAVVVVGWLALRK